MSVKVLVHPGRLEVEKGYIGATGLFITQLPTSFSTCRQTYRLMSVYKCKWTCYIKDFMHTIQVKCRLNRGYEQVVP